MSSFYENLQATANRLLTAKGQAMVHTRRAPAVYSATTGVATVPSTTQECFGVVVSGSQKNRNDDATTKSMTRILVTASASFVSPEIGDTFTFGGVDYTVNVVDNVSPAGLVVVWDLQVASGV